MKAQASIEFLIYSVVFTVALVGAFVMITSLSYSHLIQSQRAVGIAVAERIAQAITLVSLMPDGTYYYLQLPPTVGKLPYTVELKQLRDGNFVELTYSDQSVLALYQGNAVLKCPIKGGERLILRKVHSYVEVECA